MKPNIRAIVVDDEPLACKRLVKLLKEDEEVEVVDVCANGKEAIEQINKQEPELVFLDIQMPEINGFEVLKHIETEQVPAIIFVTAYDEYALKAFEVHALDYLMKPFSKDRFRDSLQRAKNTLKNENSVQVEEKIQNLLDYMEPEQESLSRILIKTSNRYFFMKAEDIDWIESAGNYVRIHSGKDHYLIRETMINMEKKLDSDKFFRIHRSTIINVEKVRELEQWFHGDYQVIMYNDEKLTMSRNYKGLLDRFS